MMWLGTELALAEMYMALGKVIRRVGVRMRVFDTERERKSCGREA